MTTTNPTSQASTTAAPARGLYAGCDDNVCKRPDCVCARDLPPAGLRNDQMPQFVMLSFDGAVNVVNMKFYRELLEGARRKNKANGCGIAATFFVSHEYLDYVAVNELYSWGNEIALHSISHQTNWDYWHTINSTQWEREVVDQKVMLQTFANISGFDITGVRGPFLVSGGDQGFRKLSQHFRYDSTLVHPRRSDEKPFFPYTMDFGFQLSCNVDPCPNGTYPGLWLLPVNVLFRQQMPCAVADACMPQPTSAKETFEFLRSNFEYFYTTNRAPFPVFLQEGYLRDPGRKQGYLQFIDWLLQKDDVYLVTASEVLDFMQDPEPLGVYNQLVCPGGGAVVNTCPKPTTCSYKRTQLGSDRYMRICSRCPRKYPWVGNPLGN
ncbi:hypothetical protein V5799_027457 [Amblyomma americanum]|uniref:Peritrophic membrane chitin binding protein n=1 Tax=Amblyomma americanum TaxID=6943 RepID=A0AAQ4DFN8_AMBAM